MARQRRLKHRIEQIRKRHPHHWKNAVWAWANSGDSWKRKLRRFRAYRRYATQHERWLIKNLKPGEERKDRRHELQVAQDAAEKKIHHLREAHRKEPDVPVTPSSGFVTVDGRPVCGWMAPWIAKIREAGWGGVIVSGVRTPAQSTALCYGMCGQPRCQNCAGASSNHNATTCAFPQGALDVSDYITFGYLARKVNAPFHNALPTDPVHFSNSGH